ncbi:MAG: DUF169 domain-containing protein [Bacteroidales bacterium]|nr:DUF169 domain-containing protein [Bacteroidales bacterium]
MKEKFLILWKKYFGNAELPITFYFTDGDGGAEWAKKPQSWSCIICELAKVRKGKSLVYDAERVACGGAKRYLGYTEKMRPGFEYFLSCGNEKIKGERYLQTPEQVNKFMSQFPKLPGSGRNIVFKRWDKLTADEKPEVAIFFATPDVLSGLFTLAAFDQKDPHGTIAPFGSGCSSIVYYPYRESLQESPRAVIGMFDISARPCVGENILTFALPVKRLEQMMNNMEESFLITESWQKVQKRITV